MSTSEQFLARVGIRYPIIQAPMAGVSSPQLAAAVANAGALGSLGLGASTAAQARQAIEETRALTDKPFNVNVFCHLPAQRNDGLETAWIERLAPLFAEVDAAPPTELDEIYTSFLHSEDVFETLLDLKPTIVSFHFGLPTREQLGALRKAGIYTLATATSLQEAQLIEEAGVDAIIAQGIEAGGHRGNFDREVITSQSGEYAIDERLPTSVLTRLLVQRVKLPVIAAGGIMDGQGIKAALDLGAVAAQLGTAFILCPESTANEGYRRNLKSERAAMTRLTNVLSGRPARGIVNRLISYCESADGAVPTYPVAYDAAKQLMSAAAKQGNHDYAAHWAGQGAPLAREMPASQLVATLVRELSA
ncbi:NAD(P)H-dependent flavin oxidoreductase [Cupriavidus nantongensis]|uniref:Nitronate monooxygenase n=1 Tax=Cupriavidus nantongensis TaxID=1796606 RepID=A0A142JKS1_9BURK|nr:nitronate monooxygenase [Cupriavidus nantongensis]AMR78683.1 2-nitropropane dioxygenase [Cupriavidus nantongensis]